MSYDTNHVQSGAKGGLIAGVVFGAMMGMMGMLPMVAMLFKSESAIFGFILHLVFSAIIGVIFGLVFGHMVINKRTGVILGLLYGVIWWVLGPLVIMPVWLGMGLQLSVEGVNMAIPSLWGHLVFGFILGLVYPMFTKTENKNADTV
ncbi:MAG: hypothetical protein COV07_03490 [Candidatus Vogelbacteria bacterium CG10_big_fil_rev_8_21_14_0_10_45_14]|uniref:DUF1440 domain-containing protein n=1 Tax=Candidatus Vogelbacteria bacterium CG10_big_fil_rev_8_21_14_0_10_45_14 TaxID=1975042 RepID=A0A2H0RJ54_9BACT|nr:MAG: hypothetical protein COV07_03490 [Candidatus Vogelbacteria bacterium CG10_big_fil_rev_8_21_14_0_10_45_14]